MKIYILNLRYVTTFTHLTSPLRKFNNKVLITRRKKINPTSLEWTMIPNFKSDAY